MKYSHNYIELLTWHDANMQIIDIFCANTQIDMSESDASTDNTDDDDETTTDRDLVTAAADDEQRQAAEAEDDDRSNGSNNRETDSDYDDATENR
jgi:hypothetical protein